MFVLVFVLLCLVEVKALRQADPPVQGVLPNVEAFRNFRINSQFERVKRHILLILMIVVVVMIQKLTMPVLLCTSDLEDFFFFGN
jgi:hypothetical protein